MTRLKILLLSFLLFGISTTLPAQGGPKDSTVGKFMYSDQRSYVVIAVIVTILAGLILYMVRVDRKLSRLEKEQ